jgi:tellurite resistance protein TerC
MWIAFWIVIVLSLSIDLIVMRKNSALGFKKAVKMTSALISTALLFGVAIYFSLGWEKAIEYFTGYAIEYSLSVDNMFVFIFIFSYFSIERRYQHKVLLYGILGAIILRFIFIFIGIRLIDTFSWTVYVFGAILIWTAVKMLRHSEKEKSIEDNFAYKILKKFFRFSAQSAGGKFFIRENNFLCATPMFAAVFVIEMSDIIFAVDSIPAVLSITTDDFIVYTSNIFAIIGLRSLYFVLAGLSDKFKFLKYGVIVILFFVGLKMLLSRHFHILPIISLGIILFTIFVSIIASLIYDKYFSPAK